MKPHKTSSLVIAILLTVSLMSCDPEVCGYSRIVNDTGFQVRLIPYHCIVGDTISIAPQGATSNIEECMKGGTYPQFSVFDINLNPSKDSVDIVFNNTHYIRYYRPTGYDCIEKNPLSRMCYEPANGKPNHYEYHVTESDFQDAVEIN